MNRSFSIAVIGAGPKGTYALDCLATALNEHPPALPPKVHVFEPHPHPGAGPVYDLRQPNQLRLNYANGQVNMWRDASGGLSFVDWLQDRHPHLAEPLDSAPRAVVGEYLHDGFNRIAARLRRCATVQLHPRRVDRLEQVDHRWVLLAGTGSPISVDAVLITTGHASRTPPVTGLEGPRYLPFLYPIVEASVDDPPAGSVVAVRGLGLTAIDAILTLTEGRGGSFHFDSGVVPRYRPSGHEPAVILPYSRTGRLMTPKPRRPTARIAGCSAPTALEQECAEALRGTSAPVASLAAWLERVSSELLPAVCHSSEASCGQDLAYAVQVAYGRKPLTHAAALGASWRTVYPAIVRAVAERRFEDHWHEFAELARRMERLAFGPPAANAARLAALIEAGTVDLTAARNPCVQRSATGYTLVAGGSERHADSLINAVITPPGIDTCPSSLFAGLLDDGHIRLSRHTAGVDVAADTSALGAHGGRTPGLAVIGRMTDGATLGNDTLSRNLHDFPERWAANCVADLSRTSDHDHAGI